MRAATNLVSLRLTICYTLADSGPLSGPSIRKHVEQRADGTISNRNVYDVLDELQAEDLVRHEKQNATRGRFHLTEAGRDQLEEHHEWGSRCLDGSGQQELS